MRIVIPMANHLPKASRALLAIRNPKYVNMAIKNTTRIPPKSPFPVPKQRRQSPYVLQVDRNTDVPFRRPCPRTHLSLTANKPCTVFDSLFILCIGPGDQTKIQRVPTDTNYYEQHKYCDNSPHQG